LHASALDLLRSGRKKACGAVEQKKGYKERKKKKEKVALRALDKKSPIQASVAVSRERKRAKTECAGYTGKK